MKKIAIASGKGGTGKTFLSTNLFQTMERAGLCVAMVDCDAEVPNDSVFIRREQMGCEPVQVMKAVVDTDKCTFCGKCSEACSFHALTCIPAAKYIKVQSDICHGCGVCGFVCPEKAIGESFKTVGYLTAYGSGKRMELLEARTVEGQNTPVPVLRAALRKAERSGVDYLLLDAPPGCSCPFVNTVIDADLVLLVTEPTPFGLNDLKNTVDVLRRLEKDFRVVINRADLGDDRMRRYLEEERIPLLTEIPYSSGIAAGYAQGQLAVDLFGTMAGEFTELMKKIV